jgi:chorismate mutase/prephenate dehydratase
LLAIRRRKVNADFTFAPPPDYSGRDKLLGSVSFMDTVGAALDDLRAEIDRIDQTIVDLLVERTEIVRRIGEIKNDRQGGRLALRPAREAQILRNLMQQSGEQFPPEVLVRMWRELLAALTRMQAPLSVAVFAPRDGFVVWDLARDHFGSLTPMQRMESANQAIRAVGNGTTTVAVLPLPGDDDTWWLTLISERYDRLRVFARLPFVVNGAGEADETRALAIGRVDPEPSGDDLTLLAIEAEPDVSRGRLRDLMVAADLQPSWLAVWRPPKEPQSIHLVEAPGFLLEGDERVGQVLSASRGEVLRIVPLGGYPRPLRPPTMP